MSRKPTEADILMWKHLGEIETVEIFLLYREYQFSPERKWRLDFAMVDAYGVDKIGIELEGGVFIQGRHTRGAGFIKDMEKYNHATLLGWKILRFTPDQVLDGTAIAFIKRVLEA